MRSRQIAVQFTQLNTSVQPFFKTRKWKPFDFQQEAWSAFAEGRSGLIHAPTGLGKTLSAFLGPLAEEVENPSPKNTLRVIWLTPLRALAADTLESLREPVAELAPHLEVEARTGDTSGYRKKKIREKPPFALVTTPESLSLLLTYEDSRSYFESVDCVVVDEWHELIGNKRGVQTELCLARLRRFNPKLRVWGLSATLGNLEQAAKVLVPTSAPTAQPLIIHSKERKALSISTLLPKDVERFPWAGHIGTRLARQVAQQVDKHKSTLLFTNTRSQTEIWYQELASLRKKWGDQLAMHHGSLDREVRDKVEQGLREGSLKCVVCTSSLDLGVDFSPVDLVIQVGSPKGIARLMQRAGRSGHSPGATSKLICVPTNALELLEFAAARDAIESTRGVDVPSTNDKSGRDVHSTNSHIESRPPLRKPLDLLVQHLVTLLIGEPAHPDELRAEIETTNAYRHLTDAEWEWALGFITHGGDALKAYPGYQKAELLDDGTLTVTDKRKIQLHRMSIGTITSDQGILVKMGNGKLLGTIEEGFISRLKPGQQLIFAGRRLEFVRLRAHTATVRPASKNHKGQVATWNGAKMSLSTELTHAIAHRLHCDPAESPETQALQPLLEIQKKWSQLPDDTELLIEHTYLEKERLHNLFAFTLAGRSANEGLGALLAWRITRDTGATVEATQSDYGFSLSSPAELPTSEDEWRELFSTKNLVDDLLDCLNATELARRQFRDIARVAGLVVANYPGQRKTGRELQTSASLLFDVFTNYDPHNLLLGQAQQEILEKQLELTRLQAVLLTLQTLPLTIISTERLTPFAFPLWADRLQANTTGKDYATRLEAMLTSLEVSAK
ncbi:ligase-associated DNA damage response DEXH box helicase [Roseibacillus persicicus]|uniref:ligase-associated DNA damage response DEXH box helicase n=1 Tax=Roseibacillus persicicus TaxID=454148 RepID=UPI00280D566B|nr:ligase-associated DNA damage response DEXH box helicase [Roseibacillus persicicus]MDQ8189204.1 ligase-associated DNA damage response DEXH box helicase [Roseibacillus persicicus]